MYNHSLGIQRDDKVPAFKHFILKPEIDATRTMTYAKGYYDSIYGRIESSWHIDGNMARYDFSIPANTSATVYILAPGKDTVKENNSPAVSADGVKFIRMDGKYAVFETGSGKYSFASEI